MGRKLLRLVGSSEGFFSMGVTSACFREFGKMPQERERLKMWVRERRIESEGERSICEGTGSRGQVVRWVLDKSLATSVVVAGLNEGSNDCICGHGVLHGGGFCALAISSWIVSILVLKWLAISWAVSELVGGGSGGQSRVLKVEKSWRGLDERVLNQKGVYWTSSHSFQCTSIIH